LSFRLDALFESARIVLMIRGSTNRTQSVATMPGIPTVSLPTSPVPNRIRRRRWLNVRVILGVVLVLGSVTVGALAVSSADHRVRMLIASRSLSAGTVLSDRDVEVRAVQLGSSGAEYLRAGTSVAGSTLTADMKSGELILARQIGPPSSGLLFTLPTGDAVSPQLARGDRIAVWISSKLCGSGVVLGAVTVQATRLAATGAFASTAGPTVTVQLSASQVERVARSLGLESATVRVALLAPQQLPLPETFDLTACLGHKP
jgi:hypothetical protein